jgi:hypothetical protein
MFGVCVCARARDVCVLLYLDRGLATGRSLVQGVLPIVYRSNGKNGNLDTVRVWYTMDLKKKIKLRVQLIRLKLKIK